MCFKDIEAMPYQNIFYGVNDNFFNFMELIFNVKAFLSTESECFRAKWKANFILMFL